MRCNIAAINDLSGFGKCSLTVMLPIFGACGLSASAVPTSVLSSHTGGLGAPVIIPLTEYIDSFAQHWKEIGAQFDSICSGYLSSPAQVEPVLRMIETLRDEDTLVVVDPVMGDGGHLYSNMSSEMVTAERELVAAADIIVPNITEASFLLGREYPLRPTRKMIEDMLCALCELGPKQAVITGVSLEENDLGAACIDSYGKVSFITKEHIGGHFHGTGDIFAAVLLASLLHSRSLEQSVSAAVEFVHRVIRRTAATACDERFGVQFEAEIPELMKMLHII